MELYVVLLLVVLVIGQVVLVLFFVRAKKAPEEDRSMLLLQQQLQDISRTMDTRLSESSRQVNQSIQTQLSESAKLIREVTTGLTKLDETNKRVVSFADELQNLQDILKNPKQRGILGEYYLETVLKNVLPPGRYQMQYKFEDGETVDAVVFLDRGKVLPIDSKFSLENYNRLIVEREPAERERLEKVFRQDVKNRIDETSKYVRQSENTMDFAFMFIPSEGIYYDLLINRVGSSKAVERDLLEYAFRDKKVLIVSPTSFLAYLQTVLQGLRALEIEEGAKEIRKNVEQLGRHLTVYHEYHQKLGTSLGTTVNHYNAGSREFRKINKDVLRITGAGEELEILAIEKPDKEEE